MNYGSRLHIQPTDNLGVVDRKESDTIRLRLSSGIGITPDKNTFLAEGRTDSKTIITSYPALSSEQGSQSITRLRLTPKTGSVSSELLASAFTIEQTDDWTVSAQDIDAVSEYLSLPDGATLEFVESSEETIAQKSFNKHIYRYQSTVTSRPIYTVLWEYQEGGQAIVLSLQGLIGTPDVPAVYAQLMASISYLNPLQTDEFSQLSSDWVTQSPSAYQYLSDLVSPAVTKIYHIACGIVQYGQDETAEQQCRAVTGSGFLVSNDGYIATNGHVVVYEPEDALVDALLNDPFQLSAFLNDVVGLSGRQINQLRSQPEELAAVISKIYELPEGSVSFQEKTEVLLASLGDTPLLPKNQEEVNALFSFRNTTDVKRAKLIDYDYSGKDQLNILSRNTEGFTQSDVALLKITTTDAPLIHLAQPSDISQGQAITLLGFPSDAENELVDTTELSVSVTNGTISSIRTAVGGNGRLFQTDTDASQGNSGGPAVNQSGEAVGLLTYRFKDDLTQNAAKSYVRDIDDFRRIIRDRGLTLDTNSTVQQQWSAGLQLFSESKFSTALPHFEEVKRRYPAHRLADTYIDAATTQIQAGRDVQDTPVIVYVGLIAGIATLVGAIVLIARHHGHHHIYRAVYGLMSPVHTDKGLIASHTITDNMPSHQQPSNIEPQR
jgi:S1-C subfamily serine protease